VLCIHPHKQPFPLLFICSLQVLESHNEVFPEPFLLQDKSSEKKARICRLFQFQDTSAQCHTCHLYGTYDLWIPEHHPWYHCYFLHCFTLKAALWLHTSYLFPLVVSSKKHEFLRDLISSFRILLVPADISDGPEEYEFDVKLQRNMTVLLKH